MEILRESPHHPHWQLFAHGSDIGVRGVGTTLSEAFETAGLALTAMITDVELVESTEEINIICAAPDKEMLLVDWLNSIIYEMATRNLLFCEFKVHLEKNTLKATLRGETVDRKKHAPAVEPKGATFTDLIVNNLPDGTWVAQCVVDV